MELVCDTQKPELLNGSLVGSATELVCFRQVSAAALRATEKALSDAGGEFSPDALRAFGVVGFNRCSERRRQSRHGCQP